MSRIQIERLSGGGILVYKGNGSDENRSHLCLMSYVTYYSADTLSQAMLSQHALGQLSHSPVQAVLSSHTSVQVLSVQSSVVPLVLLPLQEAKETATIAANTNANFFIFF